MAEVELALAASARSWVDSLHSFLADHGGARVRTVLMGPDDVSAESYDVLIIDDVCSFLTPRLVEQARRLGRQVIGVFDARDGVDAKRRLLDCGVDDVVESGASPEEFLAVVSGVMELAPFVPPKAPEATAETRTGKVVVVGSPPGGCGATEISLALAGLTGSVLVDADDVAPSLAQRIGVPMTPNLRTAIDLVHHQVQGLDQAVVRWEGLGVVAGLASGEDWSQLHAGEVEAVIDELAVRNPTVVVDIASGLERPQLGTGRFGLARALVRRADVVVAVGRPEPVSLARLIRWVAEASVVNPEAPIVVALNRTGRSPYRKAEVETELARSLPGCPVVFVPDDSRVEEAAWSGRPVGKGPFQRAVARLAREVGL